MTKTNEEKIFTQINDEVIELKGDEKETFIANRNKTNNDYEVELKTKANAKLEAKAKLAALGLTDEDIKALGL